MSETLIKLDGMEQGQPLTLTSDLSHLQGALLSQGNKRSANTVGAAIEALTAAQAAVKRRDEVIAQIFVSVEGFNYGRCPPDSVKQMGDCKIGCKCCWRNWVDAKLKEGV
jgi:hypothetical protein